MKRIQVADGRYVKVDDEDYEALSKHRWHVYPCGKWSYVGRVDKDTGKHVRMHREILGLSSHSVRTESFSTGFVDGDGFNCQRSNLKKPKTPKASRYPLPPHKSGARGVSYHGPTGLYRAYTNVGRPRRECLGYFDTLEEAVAARRKADEADKLACRLDRRRSSGVLL